MRPLHMGFIGGRRLGAKRQAASPSKVHRCVREGEGERRGATSLDAWNPTDCRTAVSNVPERVRKVESFHDHDDFLIQLISTMVVVATTTIILHTVGHVWRW